MVSNIGSNPASILKKMEGLARADDGQISAGEQEVLNQLKTTFDNIDSPHIRELIGQVAERMGLAGAQATARMASGLSADGSQGSPASSAGGNNDPLRCNSCGGSGYGGGSASAADANNSGSALPALGGKGGMMFEDMLAQFLFDVIKEMQEELKKKMAEYKAMSKSGKGGGAKAGDGAQGGGGADSDSRQLLFEEIKNLMQKMQQMIQSLSNILNTLHNGAMNAIRNIR